jgi:hypothetical protein
VIVSLVVVGIVAVVVIVMVAVVVVNDVVEWGIVVAVVVDLAVYAADCQNRVMTSMKEKERNPVKMR